MAGGPLRPSMEPDYIPPRSTDYDGQHNISMASKNNIVNEE